jgi:hypothetical protein
MMVRVEGALYGFAESGKRWFDCLSTFLRDSGYVQSEVDPCIFFKGILLKTIDSCADPQLLIASDLLPSLMVSLRVMKPRTIPMRCVSSRLPLIHALATCSLTWCLRQAGLLSCLLSLYETCFSNQNSLLTRAELEESDTNRAKQFPVTVPAGKVVDLVLRIMNTDKSSAATVRQMTLSPQLRALLFSEQENEEDEKEADERMKQKKRSQPAPVATQQPLSSSEVASRTRSETALARSLQKL